MIDRVVRFINTVSFHRGLALGALVGAAREPAGERRDERAYPGVGGRG